MERMPLFTITTMTSSVESCLQVSAQSQSSLWSIMAFRVIVSIFIVLVQLQLKIVALNDEALRKLSTAETAVKASIDALHKEWQIDMFPHFLKSCSMHKVSWEIMKLKYQKKILSSLQAGSRTKFVISFTGSSVTAGHDSHFNASTPVVTGTIMKPAFDALGIQLDSRNVALGNNPCTPYDVCVKFFCGVDADIVHWEQTYFCADNRPIIEQFIRQAITMPSQPIVVFSDSHSGKWKPEDCASKPATRVPSEQEALLLKADALHLVSEMNKDKVSERWNWLAEHMHYYHSAAIQTFQHLDHEQYSCQGPYIPEWNKGAASWHPSVIAHRMRASHHAYFWLLNLAEAIADLKGLLSHRVVDAIEKDVEHRLGKLMSPMGPAKLKSDFPDDAKCYTDYEPRSVRDKASLKAKVLSGLSSETHPTGWKHMIYEDIVDHNLVLRSLKMEYRDFKYLIHGDKDAGPLSLALDLSRDSPVFLCETPGIWGALPKGFDHLWSNTVEAYVTYNVADRTNFTFKKDAAHKLHLHYDKTNELCVMAQVGSATPHLAAGQHVLTVVATSHTRAVVAWLITA